jgi:hypothetical protein
VDRPDDDEAQEPGPVDLGLTEEFWRRVALMTDEDILTMPEAAAMARMTLDGFRYVLYHGNGGPKGFRLGKKRVFRKGEVRRWMKAAEASQQPPASGGAAA